MSNSILNHVQPRKPFRLGVDIGGTETKLVIIDEKDSIIFKKTFPTGDTSLASDTLERLSNQILQFIEESSISADEILLCGVGLPGEVDTENGIFCSSPIFPSWRNVPVTNSLRHHLDLPIIIENDANVAIIGEGNIGVGSNDDPLLLLTIGTGIGGALQINNKLYKGAFNSAGEFGHISVDPNGSECWCGNKGCLGQLGSTTALVKYYIDETGEQNNTNLDGKFVSEKILDGDPTALKALERISVYLSRGLSSAIAAIAPKKIILAGSVVETIAVPLIRNIEKNMASQQYPSAFLRVDIVPAAFGKYSGAIGAALLNNSNGI